MTITASQTDEMLLNSIAQDDREAFAELHRRHATVAYSLILKIVRDQAVADELLQETFWQVWEKAHQFDRRGSAVAWLLRVARNKSLDELRRQKARPQTILHANETQKEKIWATVEAQDADVERIAEQGQQSQQIHEALSHLPDEQKHCLMLAYFDGLSQRQIAEKTQVPLGTVKTRIRLAIDKLGHLLNQAGR